MKKLRKLVPLILALAIGLSACGNTSQYELVDATTGHELTQESPDGVVILDVRTPEEHSQARLEDSVLLDFYSQDFTSQLAKLDKEVPYFVYCRSGNRSAETVSLMKDLGFAEIYELEGGIQSWANQGLPLVSS
jgi:rhodanese-related sulfurtransferase